MAASAPPLHTKSVISRAAWLLGASAAGLIIGSVATAWANATSEALDALAVPPDDAAPTAPGEELIVELRFGRALLNDAISAYAIGPNLLLPFDALIRSLDFAISVDAAVGRASGWFVNEARTFDLDISSGVVNIEGRRMNYPPGAVQLFDDEVYVSTAVLAQWFPIDFSFDNTTLSLDVSARERMPFEDALKRKEMQARQRAIQVDTGEVFPRVTPDYTLASWPMADISMGGSYTQRGPEQTQVSTQIAGDLLFASASGFASFDQQGRLRDPRLRLERRDEEGYALGFKGLTGAAIGDTFTRNIPLIASGANGLGVSFTNQPLNRLSDLDRVTLRGNVTPGWDVELYRNGALFDFGQATPDGRYEFTDVPLQPGVNDMLVVLLGPQGQRREVTQRYYAGPGLISPGQQYFDVFVGQHEERLFRVDDDTTRDAQGTGKDRWLASFETGITPNLSLASAFARVPIGDKVRDFGLIGLRSQLGGLFGRLDFAYDDRGGIGAEVSALTRIGSSSWSVRQGWFSGLESEETRRSGEGLKLRTEVRVEQPLQLGSLPQINSAYQVRYDRLPNLDRATISARHALFVLPFALAHSLDTQVSPGTPVTVRGSLLGSARLRAKDQIRTNLAYSAGKRVRLEAMSMGWQRTLNLDTQVRADVSQAISGRRETSVVGSVTQRFKQMFVGTFAGYGGRQGAVAGISAFFSFGRGPSGSAVMRAESMASGGIVGARAFLDNDADGRYTPGDSPLENVGFSGNARTIRTRADGYALLPGTNAYQSSTLKVDESTLDDPYWVSAAPGYRAVARPGRLTLVDFPVTPTGEIAGTVYLRKGDTQTAVSNVRLMLITSTGRVVSEVKSDYDGYYLFERVPPGNYQVTVDPDQMIRQRLKVGQSKAVLLSPGENNDIRGIDLVIERLPYQEAQVAPAVLQSLTGLGQSLTGAPSHRVQP